MSTAVEKVADGWLVTAAVGGIAFAKSVAQCASEAVALFTHEARMFAMVLIFKDSGIPVMVTPAAPAPVVGVKDVFASPVLSVSRLGTAAKALIKPTPACGGFTSV